MSDKVKLRVDLSSKEDKTNKTTSLSSSSTDTQYPSAKAVYDAITEVESSSGGNYIDDYYFDTTTKDIVLEYTSGSSGSGSGGGGSVDIVTSWEQTLSDEKVPSEKLVKDTIDTKANSTHTHTTSDISNLSIPTASTSTPSADVTGGAIGSSTSYAKADHQHPLSTSYASSNHNHDSDYLAKASTDTGFVKSNGNIVAFGTTSGTVSEGNHTHSQYLTDHQSLTNYVQKSSTTGLLKNDGSVMTGGTGSTNYAIGNHTHSGYVSATKVTSWSSTVSDSNVPSEKLVKNYIDEQIGTAIQYIQQ